MDGSSNVPPPLPPSPLHESSEDEESGSPAARGPAETESYSMNEDYEDMDIDELEKELPPEFAPEIQRLRQLEAQIIAQNVILIIFSSILSCISACSYIIKLLVRT